MPDSIAEHIRIAAHNLREGTVRLEQQFPNYTAIGKLHIVNTALTDADSAWRRLGVVKTKLEQEARLNDIAHDMAEFPDKPTVLTNLCGRMLAHAEAGRDTSLFWATLEKSIESVRSQAAAETTPTPKDPS